MATARELDGEQIAADALTNAPEAIGDAGVNDAMFDLGGDERRMHVRAYNHWVSLLKGRPYPTIADLDPDSIADFGPHSVLLDFRPSAGTAQAASIDDPLIAYLGARLREECGLVGSITSIADVPRRSLLSRLTDHYLQIIANRAPIGFEAEFINSRGRTTLYRGILMPFASHDEGIDFLYGVINWKELADDALQATLSAELDAAVRAAPSQPASGLTAYAMSAPGLPGLGASGLAGRGMGVPMGHAPATSAGAPVWADGPSAGFDTDYRTDTPDAAPASPTEEAGKDKPVLAHVAIDSGAKPGEMVLLVARANAGGGLDIIGTVIGDTDLVERAVSAID